MKQTHKNLEQKVHIGNNSKNHEAAVPFKKKTLSNEMVVNTSTNTSNARCIFQTNSIPNAPLSTKMTVDIKINKSQMAPLSTAVTSAKRKSHISTSDDKVPPLEKTKKIKISAAASFKKQLRKEINLLKNRKKSQLISKTNKQELLKQQQGRKEKELMKEQRLEEKKQKETERERVREEKRLEKERSKNLLKEELTKNLELRHIGEQERLEKKELAEKEREAAKLNRLKEKEKKKKFDKEKRKREVDEILRDVKMRQIQNEQYANFYNLQLQQNTFTTSTPSQLQLPVVPTIYPKNVINRQNLCEPRIILPTYNRSMNNGHVTHVAHPNKILEYKNNDNQLKRKDVNLTGKNDFASIPNRDTPPDYLRHQGLMQQSFQPNRYVNPLLAHPNNHYTHPWYQHQHLYPQAQSSYGQTQGMNGWGFINRSPIIENVSPFLAHQPIILSQYSSQPKASSPKDENGLGFINRSPIIENLSPVLAHQPLVLSQYSSHHSSQPKTSSPKDEKCVRRSTSEPKLMMLCKEPLILPSPYVKTHVLLPFKIILTKDEGQNFGVDLRYDTRGTLVEVEKTQKKNESQSILATQMLSSHPSLSGTTKVNEVDKTQTINKSNLLNESVINVQVITNPLTVKSNLCNSIQPLEKVKVLKKEESELNMNDDTSPVHTTSPSESLKPKRKRISIGVMMVVDATKQNILAKENILKERLLHTGDFVLEVNGECVGGKNFEDALALFVKDGSNSKNTSALNQEESRNKIHTNDKEKIECILTVARERKVIKILDKLSELAKSPKVTVKRKKNPMKVHEIVESSINVKSIPKKLDRETAETQSELISLVLNENKSQIVSGDFTLTEFTALVLGIRNSLCGGVNDVIEMHDLNKDLFRSLIQGPTFGKALSQRDVTALINKWFFETNQVEKEMVKRALKQWKSIWIEESRDSDVKTAIKYIPESERNMIRFMPKPARGCKCGDMNHRYSNNSECFLYRNLRKFPTSESYKLAIDKVTNKKSQINQPDGKFNSIGTAHVQRMRKQKEEIEADMLEAIFVNEMERIQISVLKKAVFAPRHVTILILSTIASLSENIKDSDALETETPKDIVNMKIMSKEEKDRSRHNIVMLPEHKKINNIGVPNINSFSLAQIILHISITWGHVYKDLDHIEYAWYVHY